MERQGGKMISKISRDDRRLDRLLDRLFASHEFISRELASSDIYISGESTASIFMPGKTVFLTSDGMDTDSHAELICRRGVKKIVGTGESLEILKRYVEISGEEDSIAQYYCAGAEKYDTGEVRELITTDDYLALYDLFDTIDEFGHSFGSRDSFAKSMMEAAESGDQRVFGIFRDSICVSSATAALFGSYCIIIGVATLPMERGKGLAKQVMARLVLEMEAAGLKTYLFYSNPSAGNTYRAVGFRDIADWKIIYLA